MVWFQNLLFNPVIPSFTLPCSPGCWEHWNHKIPLFFSRGLTPKNSATVFGLVKIRVTFSVGFPDAFESNVSLLEMFLNVVRLVGKYWSAPFHGPSHRHWDTDSWMSIFIAVSPLFSTFSKNTSIDRWWEVDFWDLHA